jgi:hypothetical protein
MDRFIITAAVLAVLLIASQAAALYVINDDRALWPDNGGGHEVPVCWGPNIDPEGSLPRQIRAAVEGQFSSYADIRFTGWGRCPEDTPSMDEHIIFIKRRKSGELNAAGESDVGRQFKGFKGDTPRPTVMPLSFDANLLCDTIPWAGYSNDDCVRWTAVHEFGHALGFLHEHDRPDFPGCFPWDKFWPDKQGGGIELTAYDSGSVMNYCSAGAGTNKGRLTPKDIVGLQIVYGRKPWGSFVETGGPDGGGGRCMDVHNINIGNGNHVQLWDCWGGLNQRWHWSPVEGTLQPEEAPGFCLDDASGSTIHGTPLDVWQCDQRATARWDFDHIYIRSLGNKCLEFKDGQSVLSGCTLGKEWTYNDRGMLVRMGTNQCLDVSPGEVGSRARLASCNRNSYTQKFLLTRAGQLLSNGRCLEVADGGLFKVNDNTPIRLAECGGNNLAQEFSFWGWIKGSGGSCVTETSDGSRNGVRLVVGPCDKALLFYFYFGNIEVNFE